MKTTLIFDTETTGLIDEKQSLYESWQPYLLQLAAALFGEDGQERGCFSMLVRLPPAVIVPPEAQEVNGLTAGLCSTYGGSLHSALFLLQMFCSRADEIVAYNAGFDCRIIAIECARLHIGEPWHPLTPIVCAMELAARHTVSRGHGGKSSYPKLGQAYHELTGDTHERAHDALADVRATARVYFACRRLEGSAS